MDESDLDVVTETYKQKFRYLNYLPLADWESNISSVYDRDGRFAAYDNL